MDSCCDKLVIYKQNSLYKWYCCCPNILSAVNMRGYELSITCWLQIKVNIFSSLIFLCRSFEAFKGKASFEAFLIILIMMKCEAICRALLNLSWKVLEAPSLWVTEIVNYRKNYIFPFGKKKGILWGTSHILFPNPKYIMEVHVTLLLSDVPILLGQQEEPFLWRTSATLSVRISSLEEYLTPFLKYVSGTSAVPVPSDKLF